MAVNAGQFFFPALGVPGFGNFRLLFWIHLRFVMAKTAFARVIAFHISPDPRCHHGALGIKFLWRVNRVRDVMAPQVVERTHFGDVQRKRSVRNVAVSARGAYTGTILVVNGVTVFTRVVIGHLMAIIGAKLLCAGVDHARAEEAQGDKAHDKPRKQNHHSSFAGDQASQL
jgi:hypothetical protein